MKHPRHATLAFAALTMLASTALAAEPEIVKGRIQELNPSTHRVTIVTDQGKELTFQVDERSRLEQSGKEAALDQFKKGNWVRVHFESRDGENRVVSMSNAAPSAEQVQNEIRNALQAAKAYTFQHKDEYARRLERVLQQADDRIDQLKQQAAQVGSEAKVKYARQLEQLRRLRDRAQAEAERVRAATPGAWEDLKSGVSAAFEDLRKCFEKAGERFR